MKAHSILCLSIPRLHNTFSMTPPPLQTLDDLQQIIKTLPGPCLESVESVRTRNATLTKPPGALGRLEEIVLWMAAWQRTAEPAMRLPLVALFAGNHGVARHGVSAYPPSVTQSMVENFKTGGAAINQICATLELGLKVFELALELPTGDITQEPALTPHVTLGTFLYGMEALAEPVDLLCLGEMGIGNTTVAAAIYHALYGGQAKDWVGRGTGVGEERFSRKISIVEEAVAYHRAFCHSPLDILCRLGGREIAAMAGAIIAARLQKVPVLLDGYVVTAAAAILHALSPASIDHCLAAHCSSEGAHAAVLNRLGQRPLLALDLRLGEGTGAALATSLVKSACACHQNMATFAQAHVAEKE